MSRNLMGCLLAGLLVMGCYGAEQDLQERHTRVRVEDWDPEEAPPCLASLPRCEDYGEVLEGKQEFHPGVDPPEAATPDDCKCNLEGASYDFTALATAESGKLLVPCEVGLQCKLPSNIHYTDEWMSPSEQSMDATCQITSRQVEVFDTDCPEEPPCTGWVEVYNIRVVRGDDSGGESDGGMDGSTSESPGAPGRLCKKISYHGWDGPEGTGQDFECPDGRIYHTLWGVGCDGFRTEYEEPPAQHSCVDVFDQATQPALNQCGYRFVGCQGSDEHCLGSCKLEVLQCPGNQPTGRMVDMSMGAIAGCDFNRDGDPGNDTFDVNATCNGVPPPHEEEPQDGGSTDGGTPDGS